MTSSESHNESNRIESIRIANWNALVWMEYVFHVLLGRTFVTVLSCSVFIQKTLKTFKNVLKTFKNFF